MFRGTVIPQGFRFAVSTDGTAPAVEYAVDDMCHVNSKGYADVEVTAVIPGVSGNVEPGR